MSKVAGVRTVAPATRDGRSTPHHPSRHPLLQLQAGAGNRAVSQMLHAVQRAGPAPAVPAAPVCDPAEETKKDAFKKRSDLKVDDFTPSSGIGKFAASYNPIAGALAVVVRMHFNFVDADSTPGFWQRIARRASGQSNEMFFWSDAEKAGYVSEFTKRVHDRWSDQHLITSVKPCWTEFSAKSDISAAQVADPAKAHYDVTVHKSPGPGIDYKSAVNNENLADPSKKPTADFWSSDVKEEADFNSKKVATQERKRLEAAVAGAGPVTFAQGRSELTAAGSSALDQIGAALLAANPSAPLIPLDIEGWASSEGGVPRNTTLSGQRAEAARAHLAGQGVRQPLRPVGKGPTGSPNDASNRKVVVKVDTTFETTYATNRYSVGEHEFGHMLGNLDEYSKAGAGTLLAGAEARYNASLVSAGLSAATFGQDTSSQMSNGVDVLPRHYLSLWEVLAKITAPDLGQSDWRIH